MTFTIRPAIDRDASDLSELVIASIRSLCTDDHGGHSEAIRRWTENKTPENFARWISQPGALSFVAEANDRLLGTSLVTATGDLALLYVLPGADRGGVGSALLEASEISARQAGHAILRVTSTKTARGFYALCGFIESPTPIRNAEGGGIPMTKTLSE